MKVVSCECFGKIAETMSKSGKNLEISEFAVSFETGKSYTAMPLIYFKAGKDGVKKKEYIYMKCTYCPVCGKKIETEDN